MSSTDNPNKNSKNEQGDNRSQSSQSPHEQDPSSLQQHLAEHQQQVADQERANRIKAQDLIQREQRLEDERRMVLQERQMLTNTQATLKASRQRTTALMLPLFLVAAIAAGLFAFNHIEQQEKYFNQVATASKNIDALAKILSVTQDEVVIATSQLSTKQFELERTKSMLEELKDTTDKLQMEIFHLKGYTSSSAEEKTALTISADNLSEKFSALKAQLEDKYLSDDINEAFIEYQENGLKRAHAQLAQQTALLAEKDQLIATLKAKQLATAEPTPLNN